MSMKLFDYDCPHHGAFETWGNPGAPARCPTCGWRSPPVPAFGGISLEGISGDFPTAADKWARRHERQEEPGREI